MSIKLNSLRDFFIVNENGLTVIIDEESKKSHTMVHRIELFNECTNLIKEIKTNLTKFDCTNYVSITTIDNLTDMYKSMEQIEKIADTDIICFLELYSKYCFNLTQEQMKIINEMFNMYLKNDSWFGMLVPIYAFTQDKNILANLEKGSSLNINWIYGLDANNSYYSKDTRFYNILIKWAKLSNDSFDVPLKIVGAFMLYGLNEMPIVDFLMKKKHGLLQKKAQIREAIYNHVSKILYLRNSPGKNIEEYIKNCGKEDFVLELVNKKLNEKDLYFCDTSGVYNYIKSFLTTNANTIDPFAMTLFCIEKEWTEFLKFILQKHKFTTNEYVELCNESETKEKWSCHKLIKESWNDNFNKQ